MPEYYCSKAPAKINLFLDILRKREDGYHEIRTIFQSIALFDTLRFTIIPTGCIPLFGRPFPSAGLSEHRLQGGERASGKFEAKKGDRDLHREKDPAKRRDGSGSSDGACALYALNIIWELGLPPEELLAIAAEIGSDLPFFLTGGTAAG